MLRITYGYQKGNLVDVQPGEQWSIEKGEKHSRWYGVLDMSKRSRRQQQYLFPTARTYTKAYSKPMIDGGACLFVHMHPPLKRSRCGTHVN